MVSIELLRRYSFFDHLTEDQLRAVSMISELEQYPKGSLVSRENTAASKLYLLLEGDIDLIYSGGGEGAIVNALVGSIAPGEVFGVSSLIEPYQFISSVRAAAPVRVVAIDATALKALSELDSKLGYALMRKVSAAVLERLKFTQMELAVARA
jgi:CRP/FNR family cyclic AMP-dependent transcriptional regulator